LVALTKIMKRIVVSPSASEPGVRCPESLALPSRRMAPAGIDTTNDFFLENAKRRPFPLQGKGNKS
jgi:hypothetical protein